MAHSALESADPAANSTVAEIARHSSPRTSRRRSTARSSMERCRAPTVTIIATGGRRTRSIRRPSRWSGRAAGSPGAGHVRGALDRGDRPTTTGVERGTYTIHGRAPTPTPPHRRRRSRTATPEESEAPTVGGTSRGARPPRRRPGVRHHRAGRTPSASASRPGRAAGAGAEPAAAPTSSRRGRGRRAGSSSSSGPALRGAPAPRLTAGARRAPWT